jgi:hypothetical protein
VRIGEGWREEGGRGEVWYQVVDLLCPRMILALRVGEFLQR